jgi:peptidyl-prolyl cis-trans isomerase SurA
MLELEERIRYFAKQFGGEKGLEDFYGKTIAEIKSQNREKIRNTQLIGEMQRKIIKDVKVTPTDIKNYYNQMLEGIVYPCIVQSWKCLRLL